MDTTQKLSSVSPVSRGLKEGALIILWAVAVYLFIALSSYDALDPGWSHSKVVDKVANLGGVAGAFFADIFLYLFGYLAYLFPLMVAYSGYVVFRQRNKTTIMQAHQVLVRAAGFVLTVAAGCGLASLHFAMASGLPLSAGGILGDLVGQGLVASFNFLGGTLFLLALFLTGVTLFTTLSWVGLMDNIGKVVLVAVAAVRDLFARLSDYLEGRRAKHKRDAALVQSRKQSRFRRAPKIEPRIKTPKPGKRVVKEKQIQLFEPSSSTELPDLDLLDPADPPKNLVSHAALEATSRQVEIKLKEFNVTAEVVAVHPGPVVTRYELQLAPGVKVSQISNLAKDMARALSVISVRVVEVIPGKSTIGLEIPNEHREVVRLSEVITSEPYDHAKSPLTLALGKDISGLPIVADLTRMPHLLVAGTTGSGKSVALNVMVLSLLYKTTPQDVRLIMIDPKMLELSVYEGIPHLLAPVVTDMKEASNALRWCVAEMDNRYRLMASLGVRNIVGYNRKVKEAKDKGEPLVDPTYKPVSEDDPVRYLEPLPYIVVIVDELADMMMLVGKQVEQLIARLAQKARAAGVHLILATQRPSVDVLTGLIKANVPTRIAFQVSSKIDSRTILDQMGAEQLLGHGDMLYLPPGTGIPNRVHGAFVDDHEVHKVVDQLKSQGTPNYINEVLEGPEEGTVILPGEKSSSDDDMDPLYDEAVAFVTETRRVSISSVQRKLKVGYNRAARMVEEMERGGVVGPLQSNGAREVLAGAPPTP